MRLTDPKRQPPKYLGLYQAAQYCNISYRLTKEAVDAGRIPYRKFGTKTYRISRDELDEFMDGTDYQGRQTHDQLTRLSD